MERGGVLGRDEEHEQVYGSAVLGLEIEPLLAHRAGRRHAIHRPRLAVRDRDPVADAGGHHRLSAHDAVEDLALALEAVGGLQKLHQLD